MDGQAPRPYQAPPPLIASGSASVSDSVTETEILEVPADSTFVGWVTVVAVNRVTTTADYQTARVRIDGTTGTPANNADILVAGSSLDTGGPSTVTQYLQVTAGSSAVSLNLVNSTATTFDSCASANGIFTTKPTIS